jgi:hypothetical protein
MAQQGDVHRIPTAFETRVRLMLHWQTQRAARAIVIRELKAAGIRTSLLSTTKITRLTLDYLCRHRAELLAEAEASGAVQHLRQTISQRPVDPTAKSLIETLVQNGGAK